MFISACTKPQSDIGASQFERSLLLTGVVARGSVGASYQSFWRWISWRFETCGYSMVSVCEAQIPVGVLCPNLLPETQFGTSESIHKVVPPKFKQIGVFRVDLAVIGITDPSPSVDGFLEAVSMFSTRDRLPFVKSYRGFRKDPKCGQQRTHHCRSSGHFRDLIEVTECLLTTELTLIFVVYPG